MAGISVVIITRNEEKNIVDCIRSAKSISRDIVIVDCGSDDDTIALAKNEGARVFVIEWKGYGHSRNYGAAKAETDWILALDADERISELLADSISCLDLHDPNATYRFRRRNYIGNSRIRLGTPGFEYVTRIYNRKKTGWDLSLVHEKMEPPETRSRLLKGHIDHFTFRDYSDHLAKLKYYALLNAEKYASQGRKAGFLKKYGSPLFNSFKSYILQLGFLEGRKGFMVAKAIAYYSWLKYHYLQQEIERQRSDYHRSGVEPAGN